MSAWKGDCPPWDRRSQSFSPLPELQSTNEINSHLFVPLQREQMNKSVQKEARRVLAVHVLYEVRLLSRFVIAHRASEERLLATLVLLVPPQRPFDFIAFAAFVAGIVT